MIERVKANIRNVVYTGTWTDKKIPVYTVYDANALNQLVGYVKHINAGNGTVLYRGQCDLYPSVIPKICRNRTPDAISSEKEKMGDLLEQMSKDEGIHKILHLREAEIAGWDIYKKIAIESTLQHYGADTTCVDFVDNHWTALWFGVYRWNEKKKKYTKRRNRKAVEEDKLIDFDVDIGPVAALPSRPAPSVKSEIKKKTMERLREQALHTEKDINELINDVLLYMDEKKEEKWQRDCDGILAKNRESQRKLDEYNKDDKSGHMYLFLYVAETNSPTFHGISFGENTYTVDLRKVLPSTFLRPCSQHGWVVKGKTIDYCYEDRIVCVIRISVKVASELLGEGLLVRQENFFPSEEHDQGYRVLLQRTENSRVPATKDYPKIMPEKTIE